MSGAVNAGGECYRPERSPPAPATSPLSRAASYSARAWMRSALLFKGSTYTTPTVLTDNVLCREATGGLGQQVSTHRQRPVSTLP